MRAFFSCLVQPLVSHRMCAFLVGFLLFLIRLHVFVLKLPLAVWYHTAALRLSLFFRDMMLRVLASSGPLRCSSLVISAASRKRCFHERSVCYHVCINKGLPPTQPASAFSERTFIYFISALSHCANVRVCDNL